MDLLKDGHVVHNCQKLWTYGPKYSMKVQTMALMWLIRIIAKLSIQKQKPQRLDVRKNFFALCVTDQWNSLPEQVVNASNIDVLKGRLDKLWAMKQYEYDE